MDARHRHVVRELDLAVVDRAGDRRRAARVRRAGHRDVALAGEQPGGRVQADPARARQVDLAPGVQVGEVALGARRAVERLDVGLELDQVARHEARRQAAVPQQLHQQPAAVAARTRRRPQRLLGRLHARLHADQVADLALQALVELDQEVDRALRLLALDRAQQLREQRRRLVPGQVRRQVVRSGGVVAERKLLGLGLEEEVEGVEHRHLGDHVDGNLEVRRRLREHQPRQVVAERVLLPVDEVLGRLDAQREALDRRAAMRRRAQAHHLRPERDPPVIAVARDMVQRDMDRHGVSLSSPMPAERATSRP
jgi:hypothetical protein